MITLTITAERAEGKTRLGLVIKWLLEHFTKYETTYTETGITLDQLNRFKKEYNRFNPDIIQEESKLRRVSIVVINTRHDHQAYPKNTMEALHKSFGD